MKIRIEWDEVLGLLLVLTMVGGFISLAVTGQWESFCYNLILLSFVIAGAMAE